VLMSLLQTKLYVPGSPEPDEQFHYVGRQRLLQKLTAGLAKKLTLVCAPAGFGKTTLVGGWIAQLGLATAPDPPPSPGQKATFCWLSLDEGDNDPARFWSYVATALKTICAGVGEPVLNALQGAGTFSTAPPIEALLIALINGLAQTDGHMTLVLDDYHTIHAPPIHDALQFLLDHQPGNLHLILLTRSDPPLSLARLRARRQLVELRSADLRFTLEETATFLHQTMKLPLSPAQVAQLETHTEGWIVGLQLAALSMQGRSDVADFISSFTGSNRFVLDYLIDEVLQRQPERVQTFLLHTAILDHLHPALCDALTGGQDSRTLLHQLERENLFLIPLDETHTWWRYHHLFADVLRTRLQEHQPDLIPFLHRRAAAWFAQHNFLSAAIEHALTASDFVLAADLIERSADALVKQGEHHTLRGWLQRLPISVLDANPRLLLVHATVLVFLHQLDRAERDLDAAQLGAQRAESALHQRVLGEVLVIRANIASQRDDITHAVTLAQQALAALPPESVRLRGETMFRLGVAYAWQGHVAEATEAYTEARRLGLEANDVYTALLALINLAALQSEQGQLSQALASQHAALAWATAQGAQQMPILSIAHAELARLFYEFNELDQAVHHIEAAIRASERGGLLRLLVDAHCLMVTVRQAQGEFGLAQAALHQAEQVLEQYRLPLRYRSFALRTKMLLALASGDLVSASQGADNRGLTVANEIEYSHEEEHMGLAHLLVAQGHYAEALTFLGRLHSFAERQGRFNAVIPMLALKAKALHLLGDREEALATLERGLALAAPQGYVRTFVDQGEAMKSLIAELTMGLTRHPLHAEQEALYHYLSALLSAFPGGTTSGDELPTQPPTSDAHRVRTTASQILVEPLSERELEVLRLLADGAANQEIAEQLVVAVNTVKRHVSNIFGKLGVANRTQAVAQARTLGLL
jgi:LuxR family transcriptional regulator, maltose regulon positive regulatory protein